MKTPTKCLILPSVSVYPVRPCSSLVFENDKISPKMKSIQLTQFNFFCL